MLYLARLPTTTRAQNGRIAEQPLFGLIIPFSTMKSHVTPALWPRWLVSIQTDTRPRVSDAFVNKSTKTRQTDRRWRVSRPPPRSSLWSSRSPALPARGAHKPSGIEVSSSIPSLRLSSQQDPRAETATYLLFVCSLPYHPTPRIRFHPPSCPSTSSPLLTSSFRFGDPETLPLPFLSVSRSFAVHGAGRRGLAAAEAETPVGGAGGGVAGQAPEPSLLRLCVPSSGPAAARGCDEHGPEWLRCLPSTDPLRALEQQECDAALTDGPTPEAAPVLAELPRPAAYSVAVVDRQAGARSLREVMPCLPGEMCEAPVPSMSRLLSVSLCLCGPLLPVQHQSSAVLALGLCLFFLMLFPPPPKLDLSTRLAHDSNIVLSTHFSCGGPKRATAPTTTLRGGSGPWLPSTQRGSCLTRTRTRPCRTTLKLLSSCSTAPVLRFAAASASAASWMRRGATRPPSATFVLVTAATALQVPFLVAPRGRQ